MGAFSMAILICANCKYIRMYDCPTPEPDAYESVRLKSGQFGPNPECHARAIYSMRINPVTGNTWYNARNVVLCAKRNRKGKCKFYEEKENG